MLLIYHHLGILTCTGHAGWSTNHAENGKHNHTFV
jgi:hypothetical protein